MLQVLTDELLNDTIEINQKSRQEYCIASTMISDTRVRRNACRLFTIKMCL